MNSFNKSLIMKNIMRIFVLFLLIISTAKAQEFVFSMEVSGDTVLLGNYVELTYTIENAKGKFEAPSFEGLRVVAGPNYSNSISIINGEMKSKESFSYYLEPPDVGIFTIDPAFFIKDGNTYESRPLEIIALPNPDGIKTHPRKKIYRDSFNLDDFNKNIQPKKKKRKLKKI